MFSLGMKIYNIVIKQKECIRRSVEEEGAKGA